MVNSYIRYIYLFKCRGVIISDKYYVSIDMVSKELEEKIFKVEIIDKINNIAKIDGLIGECQDGLGGKYRYLYHFDYHTKSEIIDIAERYYTILKKNNIGIQKGHISILDTTRDKMVKWWE